MASFSDALAAQVTIKGPPCSVGLVLDEMADTDAQALQSALDTANIPATHIVGALRQLGHRIGSQAILRHRRGDCKCNAQVAA